MVVPQPSPIPGPLLCEHGSPFASPIKNHKGLPGPLPMGSPQGLVQDLVPGGLLPLSGKAFLLQKYHTGASSTVPSGLDDPAALHTWSNPAANPAQTELLRMEFGVPESIVQKGKGHRELATAVR